MMKTQLLKTTTVLNSLLLLVFAGNSLAVADTLRTVALSGAPAPGTLAGVKFLSLSRPALNDAGQTAFTGRLTGTGTDRTNDRGIWSEGGGNGLTLVARTGNAAPGTADGVKFARLSSPFLGNAGQTAFSGFLAGTGVDETNGSGIWSERGGNGLSLVTRLVSGSLFGLAINNAGQTVFSSFFSGTEVDETNVGGIWSEEGGNGLTLVARTGNAAPGTPDGVNFVWSDMSAPAFNDAGRVAFSNFFLTGTGVDGTNNNGIWSEGVEGRLALVARTGNAAPGTPDGVNFSFFNFSPLALNNAGQTAFSGFLTGTGVDETNESGIWSEGGGNGLALVARGGNAAPGTPEGVNFYRFGSNPVLNNAGRTAFSGFLIGAGVVNSNNSGIWSEGGGSGLTLVAREGETAPGTADGVKFIGFDYAKTVLNSAGQTAFWARLTGTGVDESNDIGIWAKDLQGVLTLIARKGELLDVDDGSSTDFRTISDLSFYDGTGNEDGSRSGFNDLGQLAFLAKFTDGSSGVFVSNLVAVPEPTALVLAVAGLLGLGATRRRQSSQQ